MAQYAKGQRDTRRDDTLAPSFGTWLKELPNLPIIWSSPVRPVRLGSEQRPADTPANRAPVLVFPGILSNDGATSLMRRTLGAAGFDAYPGKLGVVTGIKEAVFAKAQARLEEVHARHEKPVTLGGISLGGLYARVLAQRHPEMVARVVTLGTPFSGDRRANNAWRLYEAINDHSVDNPPLPDDPRQKPPVRTIAIWSPLDGVVAPACSRGEEGECDLAIEVPDKHFQFSASRRSINHLVELLIAEEEAGRD